jgi:predicted DCC family thiol-disulfide oxidoreductase YuxK
VTTETESMEIESRKAEPGETAGAAGAAASATEPGIDIVYDGECPFCSAYVRMMRLRETVGPVRLIDARSDDPLVTRLAGAGLDFDRSMAVAYGGRTYTGGEAMTLLALLTTRSGLFNRAMRVLFASPAVSRRLYPVFVACRIAALRLLGRDLIGDGQSSRE